MPNGAGRSMNFAEGAERVRTGGFKFTSVLDNVMPSGNGLSATDRQRSLMGVDRAPIGQSTTTYDKSLWLRQGRPAYLQNQD